MTVTCDIKIDLIVSEPHCFKFFLRASYIVELFDIRHISWLEEKLRRH